MPKFRTPYDYDASPEAICEPNKDYVTNLTDSTGYNDISVIAQRSIIAAERMKRGGPVVSFRVHDDASNLSYDFDDNAIENDTYNASVDVAHHDDFDLF